MAEEYEKGVPMVLLRWAQLMLLLRAFDIGTIDCEKPEAGFRGYVYGVMALQQVSSFHC